MNGPQMHDESQDFTFGEVFKKTREKQPGEQKRKQKLEVKDQLGSIKRSQRISSKSYINKNICTRGSSPSQRLSTRSSSDSLDSCSTGSLNQDQAHANLCGGTDIGRMHDVIIIHGEDNGGNLQQSQSMAIMKERSDGHGSISVNPNLITRNDVGQHQDLEQQGETQLTNDIVGTSYETSMDRDQEIGGMNMENQACDGNDCGTLRTGVMQTDKQYTEMKNCESQQDEDADEKEEQEEQQNEEQQNEEQQQEQQQSQQQVNQNLQQQQSQMYGNYGQGSIYPHGGIGQVWYPHDATFGSSSTMQDPGVPSLHYPQANVQTSGGIGGYRQPQYTLDSVANQAYGYQTPITSYGASSSYLSPYGLGNGQYGYRTLQGNDGLRYEVMDNPGLMLGHSNNNVLPHNYRSMMQNPSSMRVVSGSSANCGYNPGMMRGVEEKDWEEDESDEEIIKLKDDRKSKKDRVKRPMNAFLVWSCQKRAVLAKNNPGMNNADISVRLGERWKAMTPAQKQPFYDEAAKIKAEHKMKHPEWSYQPKPKKRRLGQGTTWLYAITENTRGGRVSHYINSYNHYDGNLVLSSLNQSPSAQQQMSTSPSIAQSMQTTSLPNHNNMFVNPNMNHHTIGQNSNNLMSKYDTLQQANSSLYLQNQSNVVLGGNQIPQQQRTHNLLHGGQFQPSNDHMGSLFAHANIANTYPQHDLSTQARAQNLSMSSFSAPNTIPVSNIHSNVPGCSSDKYTTVLTEEEGQKLINISSSQIVKEATDKNAGQNDQVKSNQLTFDDNSIPSLRDFLHSHMMRGSDACVGDAADPNDNAPRSKSTL